MGVISSVGNDLQTYWKNLVDGVCGIDYVEDTILLCCLLPIA